MMPDSAPATLHELFWSSEIFFSPATAVEWRQRLENGVETAIRMRGLEPIEARKEAFRGLVVDYLNATFPRNYDPSRCVWCASPSPVLLPIGTGPHVWLHSDCWTPWRARRRAEAIDQLAAMKIEAP